MATGHNIPMGLRQAYLSMHRQTNAHLARCGVTADQFVLMVLLSEEDGTTQQELARRACSDPNTIRAMLVLLEDRGIVSRAKDPADGRARKVTLTRKGRQVLERSLGRTRPLGDRLLALFTPEETAALAVFLGRISESMSQLERFPAQSRPRQMRATGRKSKSFLKGQAR
jgi:DNA-binding MarR family transcriptional regulator